MPHGVQEHHKRTKKSREPECGQNRHSPPGADLRLPPPGRKPDLVRRVAVKLTRAGPAQYAFLAPCYSILMLGVHGTVAPVTLSVINHYVVPPMIKKSSLAPGRTTAARTSRGTGSQDVTSSQPSNPQQPSRCAEPAFPRSWRPRSAPRIGVGHCSSTFRRRPWPRAKPQVPQQDRPEPRSHAAGCPLPDPRPRCRPRTRRSGPCSRS